jgi:hypothetical protein
VKIDYAGVSILIGAVVAAIGSLATTVMQWRASKKIDKNKEESIAAREAQTSTIIASAVTPALMTPPPVPPVPSDADKP